MVGKNGVPQAIILYENKPDKLTVEQFIEALEEKVKTYIKEKYSKIDHDYPIEPQLQNIAWLRERRAITEQEFEQLKDIALGRSSANKIIGFKPKSRD